MRDSIESVNEALVKYDSLTGFGVRDVQKYLQEQGWVYQPKVEESDEPVERLDAAVREFVESIETNEHLAGWVLGYSTTQISNEDGVSPIGSGFNYAVGPNTLITDALGIVVSTSAVVQTVVVEDRLG